MQGESNAQKRIPQVVILNGSREKKKRKEKPPKSGGSKKKTKTKESPKLIGQACRGERREKEGREGLAE